MDFTQTDSIDGNLQQGYIPQEFYNALECETNLQWIQRLTTAITVMENVALYYATHKSEEGASA